MFGQRGQASAGALRHPPEAAHVLAVDGQGVKGGGLLLQEGDDFGEFFFAGSELEGVRDEDGVAVKVTGCEEV